MISSSPPDSMGSVGPFQTFVVSFLLIMATFHWLFWYDLLGQNFCVDCWHTIKIVCRIRTTEAIHRLVPSKNRIQLVDNNKRCLQMARDPHSPVGGRNGFQGVHILRRPWVWNVARNEVLLPNFFLPKVRGAGKKMGSNQSLIYIFYEFCEKLPILMVKTV